MSDIPKFVVTAGPDGLNALMDLDIDGDLDVHPLAGVKGQFTSNLKPGLYPVGDGLYLVESIEFVIDTDGKLNGDNGVELLAEVDGVDNLQWSISFDRANFNGKFLEIPGWGFNARDAGETVPLEELIAVKRSPSTWIGIGPRGYTPWFVAVPDTDPQLYQPTDSTGPVGDPIPLEAIVDPDQIVSVVDGVVPALVTAALAADHTPADAAAAAASTAVAAVVAALQIVLKTDPGISREVPGELTGLYHQIVTGPSNEFIRGDRRDGSVEIAIARLTKAIIAGGTYSSTAVEGVAWAPYVDPDGRIGEIQMDKGLRVPKVTTDAWKPRVGFPTYRSPMDIFVLAGQSNATQLSSAASVIEPAIEGAVEWNGTQFIPLAGGVPWLGSGFAREFARRHGRPEGRCVCVVRTAVGGTSFNAADPTWDRTKTGATVNLYAQMIAKAQAVLAVAPAGSRIAGILWSQGENDRFAMSPSAYQAKLDDLITQARIDLGDTQLPFMISSLTPEIIRYDLSTSSTAGRDMNATLEDTPRRLQRTSFTFGPDGMADPAAVDHGVHWSPMGQSLRGETMAADAYNQALLNVPPSTGSMLLPPPGLKATRSGGTIIFEWGHPTGRLTGFVLELSTDGTTYTAQTLPSTLTHTFTTTAFSASTPVWARIKSVNSESGGTSLTSKEIRI
jgi:hypothetical protein